MRRLDPLQDNAAEHHSVLVNLSISARARSMVGSSPEPMADNALWIAARHAGAHVGWFSDLMGRVVSW
jgi:hypothetical protein